MNHNAGTVPFNYGDLLAVTPPGPTFWFQDKSGVIRGVKLVADNGTYKLLLGDEEILVRRSGAGESSRPGVRAPMPGSMSGKSPGNDTAVLQRPTDISRTQ